jgi:UDP-glucose 4-epimerase
VKILITGGAGYIGGTVTQLLLDRGHTVVVYDNLCHAQRSMVPAGAAFVEGDVADSKRLGELFADGSFAGVMHFAALIEAGDSMRVPEVYFRNNTAATLGLLEAAVKVMITPLPPPSGRSATAALRVIARDSRSASLTAARESA